MRNDVFIFASLAQALATVFVFVFQFLIVLSKMDVSYRQMRNEALLMLQMKRLQSEVRQQITVLEASAITGDGRDKILEWLKK